MTQDSEGLSCFTPQEQMAMQASQENFRALIGASSQENPQRVAHEPAITLTQNALGEIQAKCNRVLSDVAYFHTRFHGAEPTLTKVSGSISEATDTTPITKNLLEINKTLDDIISYLTEIV